MRWDELTSDLFKEAVKASEGVCLLPLACIERHGHHLPLGTDMFIARELCHRIALLEPVVIFPDFIFTQILEARHVPGTIGIQPDLIMHLMENTCAEIARNGFKKIVLINAHGGNEHLIHYFAQIQLASKRDYVVFVPRPYYQVEDTPAAKIWESSVDGHAGERETSLILTIRPELVRADSLPEDGEGNPLGRLQKLNKLGVDTGIWWYADHPTHYCGDGRFGTAKKGETWFEARSQELARTVRAIKEDEIAGTLQSEFFNRVDL
jgi:creatinine amidohydrolase